MNLHMCYTLAIKILANKKPIQKQSSLSPDQQWELGVTSTMVQDGPKLGEKGDKMQNKEKTKGDFYCRLLFCCTLFPVHHLCSLENNPSWFKSRMLFRLSFFPIFYKKLPYSVATFRTIQHFA